jgi:penicillin-binding protein 1A
MKKSVKFLWRLFLAGIIAVILLFVTINFGLFGKMPSLKELENPEADLASEVISADGVAMGKYYSENRSEVKYEEISPNIVHALIATEDERFEEHSGIDAEALARAVKSMGKDGGGSTITQQLAKMILKQGKGNVVARGMQKLKEWIVAVKLERNFTKQELIALYLNRAAWGNLFGIRNASRTYFQKEPADLKIEEAAVLVGMLKGFIYDPIRHPDKSVQRRNVVIGQMVVAQQHYLTPQQAEVLKAKPLVTNYKPLDENIGIAPHFKRALIDVLKDWCSKNKNPKTGEYYNLYADGLKIYTTIDTKMQQYAEEAVASHVPGEQRKLNGALRGMGDRIWRKHENVLEKAITSSVRWKTMKEDGIKDEEIRKSFYVPTRMKIFSWRNGGTEYEMDTLMTPFDSIKYHKKLLQTSFMAMDPRSGEIKAWVGSTSFKWFKYDHVTAMRQVGSTFKPLVYTLAVTDAGYTPETYIAGGNLRYDGKIISVGGGTCAHCLANSINGCALRLINTVGIPRTLEFAKQCGISVKIPPYASIALGSAEIPMTQMLQMYTMFPNRGYNTAPVYFTRIEDKNGNLVYEAPVAQSKQVIGEVDAYTMVKMMQGVVREGTAKRLNSYRIPAEKAGKTGTTNDNTDGWFIGYTPTLLAGTWLGCEDPFIPIYGNRGGAEMAAPAWGMFMAKVYNDKKFKSYADKKSFDIPMELKNDPVLADAQFYEALKRGDGDRFEGDRSQYRERKGNNEPEESNGSEFFDTDNNGKANEADELGGTLDTSQKTPATPPKPTVIKQPAAATDPKKKPTNPTTPDNDFK